MSIKSNSLESIFGERAKEIGDALDNLPRVSHDYCDGDPGPTYMSQEQKVSEEEVLARMEKALTYYINAGVDMKEIACAKKTIELFEARKKDTEKLISGFKEDLDKARKARTAWLRDQLDSPSKTSRLFAAMQDPKTHPEEWKEIATLENKIKGYSEDLNETQEVVAAKKLIKQFEKFEENPQLELKFEQLQEEYKDAFVKEKRNF